MNGIGCTGHPGTQPCPVHPGGNWWSAQRIEAWKRDHGGRTTKTARARPDFARIDELLARATPKPRQREPYTPDWSDTAVDAWGNRERNQPLARTYRGGNCLKATIASILNVAIEKVPDPTVVEYADKDRPWFDAYNTRLAKKTGHRLEEIPKALCPPRGNALWICGISMPDDPDDHVVVARNRFVIFDPAGEFTGQIPWQRVLEGYLLRPTRRVVPALSINGRTRHTIIPA